ncbi:anthranilate phosphoribosyltransferase [Fusobacterium sp. IOR10]|uniref:anthranilate phosphoribosyltransferase n=1 Tax=Fusobacterium sp. IOR10 TaxID=2665157 RepID=UPI0013D559EF|nr:anthranilate phosphoribosyltransferase [Fusobacterium sp. IOR10]
MKEIIKKLVNLNNLSASEMEYAMNYIMDENSDDILISSFLTALSIKKETSVEVTAGAKVLRNLATKVNVDDLVMIDIVGTGGDLSNTFNISTATAIVVAAGGGCVIKHGNRSVSSNCGSADVLEGLGVKLDLTPEEVKECVQRTNLSFLYAPSFHRAMKNVGKVRKNLGLRTIFNILGPLINPGSANHMLVGVYEERLMDIYGDVLKNLGVKKALIVYGEDGLDEATITGNTKVLELNNGVFKKYTINPRDFGFELGKKEDIQGRDAIFNGKIIKDIFKGEKGAKRDIVILNSALAMYASNLVTSIEDGILKAKKIIDERLAYKKLEEFILVSNEV